MWVSKIIFATALACEATFPDLFWAPSPNQVPKMDQNKTKKCFLYSETNGRSVIVSVSDVALPVFKKIHIQLRFQK